MMCGKRTKERRLLLDDSVYRLVDMHLFRRRDKAIGLIR